MELLPCDMYIYQRLGKFGRDFSSYQGFLSLTESANYSKTMDEIRRLPSDECTTCERFGVCYGGCPVLWKNYSFSALKEFKAKAHHSGVSEEVSWLQELEISYLQSQREMLYSFVQLASISIIPHYTLDFEGIMGYNST